MTLEPTTLGDKNPGCIHPTNNITTQVIQLTPPPPPPNITYSTEAHKHKRATERHTREPQARQVIAAEKMTTSLNTS